MADRPRIGRDVLMILIGAALAALFGIVVAYPALLANTRENATRIDANEKQIERLWDAHQVGHDTPTLGGDEKQ